MAQQPNVEITEATAPRPQPQPGPATTWRSAKPGIPAAPADVPVGSGFGHAGPDPGWGIRLVNSVELPDDDPRLRSVVTGLVLARAAALGRAPVPEDIEAALVLCGYGDEVSSDLVERRERWLEAASHDKRPGATAVSEVDRDLIVNKPEQIRYAHKLAEKQ
jgi:hypothetical protein